MMYTTSVVLLLPLLLVVHTGYCSVVINLTQWTAHGHGEGGKPISMPAIVPGDIYTDAIRAGLIADPYVGENDVKTRWLGQNNWTYVCEFNVEQSAIDANSFVLMQEGVQTIADTFLNGVKILTSKSMFIGQHRHITQLIKAGVNQLSVQFTPPQTYALEQANSFADKFAYSVPPDGPPDVQHGINHVNMIRTMQSQFSWDWGPAFPTMGIYKPLFIIAIASCQVTKLSAQPRLINGNTWSVHIALQFMCHTRIPRVTVCLRMAAIDVVNTFDVHNVLAGVTTVNHVLNVSDTQVERWWPNGYGDQSLYTLNATVGVDGYQAHRGKVARIGFRTVKLVQEPVPGFTESQAGLTFYFEVNGVPIFLKGSNWIPADSFQSRVTPDRIRFLFASMTAANMNAMRVWGGGVYETDYFYELADEHGILIWQDMMFAVALYPADAPFLALVAEEIQQQVARLAPHPSILVWAGNNENELGLDGYWFHTRGTMPSNAQMKHDYMMLYNTTVWAAVNKTERTDRPYLLSSPSSGVQEIRHSGFAPNPASAIYGDVHFYDYFRDAWKTSTLMTPRCVTEFGFQSMPNPQTMLRALPNNTEWSWFGQPLLHRQHHALGNVEMLTQVLSHFRVPSCHMESLSGHPQCDGDGYVTSYGMLSRLTYLTQMHQARAYQNQVHHYRSYRNRTTAQGKGQTMCALYWQLNDIWQAPTWASIDYDQQWKAAQYMARRFFAPLLLDVRVDDKELTIRLTSDLQYPVEGASLSISSYELGGGLTPVINVTTDVLKTVPALSSEIVWRSPLRRLVHDVLHAHENGFVLVARLNHASLSTFDGEYIPNNFHLHSPHDFGRVTIAGVTKTDNHTYSVELEISNDRPAFYVWLEVIGTRTRGWFDDNAFAMTTTRRTVVYTLWEGEPDMDLEEFRQAVHVQSLSNVYDTLT